MAVTPKRLFGPALLSAAAATKYTVPASTKTTIRHIHFFNQAAVTRAVTASIGADAAATELLTAYPIAAKTPYDWYGYVVMDAAEIMQAFADNANDINMTVFGDESTP